MSHYVPFTLLKKLTILEPTLPAVSSLIIFLKETEAYVFMLHFLTYSAPLKGPKHENFDSEFLTPSRPIWVGNLQTGRKNSFCNLGRSL
jgi:hypothetical protein